MTRALVVGPDGPVEPDDGVWLVARLVDGPRSGATYSLRTPLPPHMCVIADKPTAAYWMQGTNKQPGTVRVAEYRVARQTRRDVIAGRVPYVYAGQTGG